MPTHLKPSDFRVALIGAGTVGTLVAKALTEKGYRFTAVISRLAGKAAKVAAAVAAPVSGDKLSLIPSDTNLLLVAVPDAEIGRVAKDLAKHKLAFKNLYAVHFSGALPSDALSPLADKGAATLSLHPFQTFPRKSAETKNVFTCYFGLQAADVEGLDVGKQLAHDLGGKVMLVPKDAKALYHIAAVMMSNYVVTLTNLSAEIFGSLGLKPKDAFKVFEPLVQSTLQNLKFSDDLSDALSGPIERGDAASLKVHLTELSEQMPHLIPTYAALAMETVRVAIRKGSINQTEAMNLLDLLESFTRRESQV